VKVKSHTAFLLEAAMGNRLKVVRAEKRITQFRLTLATGIIQSRLSQMENDLIKPTPEEKEKIAKALG